MRSPPPKVIRSKPTTEDSSSAASGGRVTREFGSVVPSNRNGREWSDPTGMAALSLPSLGGQRSLLAQCRRCGTTATAYERRNGPGRMSVAVPGLILEAPFDGLIATAQRRWRVLQEQANRSDQAADRRRAAELLSRVRDLQDASRLAPAIHRACGGRLKFFQLGFGQEPGPLPGDDRQLNFNYLAEEGLL